VISGEKCIEKFIAIKQLALMQFMHQLALAQMKKKRWMVFKTKLMLII